MKLTLVIFLALPLPADDPKPAPPQQIDPVYILQMQLLEAQATILKLKVCSDAKIHHADCIPSWQSGTVSKAAPPAVPPAPKAEPAKAK